MKQMKATKILWATRVGAPSWQEQLITEIEERIPAASAWAKANGFDRLRVSTFAEGTKPDFTKVLNQKRV